MYSFDETITCPICNKKEYIHYYHNLLDNNYYCSKCFLVINKCNKNNVLYTYRDEIYSELEFDRLLKLKAFL